MTNKELISKLELALNGITVAVDELGFIDGMETYCEQLMGIAMDIEWNITFMDSLHGTSCSQWNTKRTSRNCNCMCPGYCCNFSNGIDIGSIKCYNVLWQ